MTESEDVMFVGSNGNSSVKARVAAENGLELMKFTVGKAQSIIEEQEHLRKKLQDKVQLLKNDVNAQEDVARESKNKLKQIQEQTVVIKDQLLSLNQDKMNAAQRIVNQFNAIRRLYIEEPIDVSNQLFKWYLAVVYNESSSKYDFKNFIDETINRDKGVDFANRLRGLRVFELGKDEAAMTSATLGLESAILKEMQEFNPSYMSAVKELFEYIRIINQIIKVRDELKTTEANYKKAHKKSDIDSAQYLKAFTRYESAKNDLALAEKAIKTFTKVLELAQNSQNLCRTELGQN